MVRYEIPAHRAKAFVEELEQLRECIDAGIGVDDLNHIRRISLTGRFMSLFGYALCVFGINPVAVLLISLGRFTRWVLVAHTVLHKAYDKLEGSSPAWHSRTFARGVRRYIDWPDWMHADDWQAHHNLHHRYVRGTRDPDRLAVNLVSLKRRPRWLRVLVLIATAMSFKWGYFGPSTRRAGHRLKEGRDRPRLEDLRESDFSRKEPGSLLERKLLLHSYLPYILLHFVLIPLAFLPFGIDIAVAALVNSVLAEALTNLHSFAVMAPSHTGLDIPIFCGKSKGRQEYYIRQVTGSTNYRCGTVVSDFLQGYMGYQIEHHLWPDLPLRQYAKVQAKVEAICRKYGILYRNHSIWRRIFEMSHAVVSDRHMTSAQVELSPDAMRRTGENVRASPPVVSVGSSEVRGSCG